MKTVEKEKSDEESDSQSLPKASPKKDFPRQKPSSPRVTKTSRRTKRLTSPMVNALLQEMDEHQLLEKEETDESESGASDTSGEDTQAPVASSSGITGGQKKGVRLLSNALHELRKEMSFDDIIQLVKKYGCININRQKVKKMAKSDIAVISPTILEGTTDNTMLSTSEEDPSWFEGLPKLVTTKEQAMSRQAMKRLNNYYNSTMKKLQSDEISKNDRGKKVISQFKRDLLRLLISNHFNETYFNRKAAEGRRLCNEDGLFKCNGACKNNKHINEDQHITNPYRDLGRRLNFQYWQLDHKIEQKSIKREILKTIKMLSRGHFKCISCSEDHHGREDLIVAGRVDSHKYYSQLFTTDNLQLVYGQCHIKKKHAGMFSGVYALCEKCYVMPEYIETANISGVKYRRLRDIALGRADDT